MRTLRRPLTLVTLLALSAALALGAVAQAGAAGAGPKADAASSYLTGIGNESPKMFKNPLYQQLHTKIVRYVAPYDAVAHSYSLTQAKQFIAAAEAAHELVLV